MIKEQFLLKLYCNRMQREGNKGASRIRKAAKGPRQNTESHYQLNTDEGEVTQARNKHHGIK